MLRAWLSLFDLLSSLPFGLVIISIASLASKHDVCQAYGASAPAGRSINRLMTLRRVGSKVHSLASTPMHACGWGRILIADATACMQ